MLVVEEAFVARGRGVLLAPRFTLAQPRPGAFRVTLRLPGGEARDAEATIEIAHVRGPLPPYAMIRLPELSPADVPPGTEVWTTD